MTDVKKEGTGTRAKQLVRSEALRECQSPPRTDSPLRSSSAADLPAHTNDNDKSPNASQYFNAEGPELSPQDKRASRCLRRSSSTFNLLSTHPRIRCVCDLGCPKCRNSRSSLQNGAVGGTTDSASENNSLNSKLSCKCSDKKQSKTGDIDGVLQGAELVNFIKTTLNKSLRDRQTLLRIEKDLYSLINDSNRRYIQFPAMSSYGRMLVHRCADLFHLVHNVEYSNKSCVVVSKFGTNGGVLPCTSFLKWCTTVFPQSAYLYHSQEVAQAKSILKRDSHSLDEMCGAGAAGAGAVKSLEQRKKEYERVRQRIFSADNFPPTDSECDWLAGQIKLMGTTKSTNKLLKVQSLEAPSSVGNSQKAKIKGSVTKSNSFEGSGRDVQTQPRLLSRKGDLASSSWRLSCSSSGYKTQSLRSTESVTPLPSVGTSPEHVASTPRPEKECRWVYAITDLATLPAGAVILSSKTGLPLTNPDGTLYRYDPNNPPDLDAIDPTFDDLTTVNNMSFKSNSSKEEKDKSFSIDDAEYIQASMYSDESQSYNYSGIDDITSELAKYHLSAQNLMSPKSERAEEVQVIEKEYATVPTFSSNSVPNFSNNSLTAIGDAVYFTQNGVTSQVTTTDLMTTTTVADINEAMAIAEADYLAAVPTSIDTGYLQQNGTMVQEQQVVEDGTTLDQSYALQVGGYRVPPLMNYSQPCPTYGVDMSAMTHPSYQATASQPTYALVPSGYQYPIYQNYQTAIPQAETVMPRYTPTAPKKSYIGQEVATYPAVYPLVPYAYPQACVSIPQYQYCPTTYPVVDQQLRYEQPQRIPSVVNYMKVPYTEAVATPEIEVQKKPVDSVPVNSVPVNSVPVAGNRSADKSNESQSNRYNRGNRNHTQSNGGTRNYADNRRNKNDGVPGVGRYQNQDGAARRNDASRRHGSMDKRQPRSRDM